MSSKNVVTRQPATGNTILDAERRSAKDHIERIRLEYSASGREKLDSLLHNSLEQLSAQLYDTSTHFVLELLQNADDNQYSCRNPRLSFTYRPGRLRVDCNETGFLPENVDAICALGLSTKRNRDATNGYTGEKGIGFKSVFKSADVVWISSRAYRFKFDRKEKFGMVAPTWADFPEHELANTTSFLLDLNQVQGTEQVIQALRNFDPGLLLFLRRLKSVYLEVQDEGRGKWVQSIRRSEARETGYSITTLSMQGHKSCYLVTTYRVKSLPQDAKRTGYSESELTLAFPILSKQRPKRITQPLYAGLPVADHGLKFLLNADFLLTASRTQIDRSSTWNQALRAATVPGFLQAIEYLNTGDMQHLWPFFVPAEGTSEFFQPVAAELLQTLRNMPLLRSTKGSMVCPVDLVYADPKRYGDDKGVLFTLSDQTADTYLSLDYPEWVIPAVERLGVRCMNDEMFVKDLDASIRAAPTKFKAQPPSWHAQLAGRLAPLADEVNLKSALRKMLLVPLANGSWTTAEDDPLLFIGNLDSFKIVQDKKAPKGSINRASFVHKERTSINPPAALDAASMAFGNTVSIVDPNSVAEELRRRLFERMGMHRMETAEMCLFLSLLHATPFFHLTDWSNAQLVSHALFLFRAKWTPTTETDLYFATADARRLKGSQLYMLRDVEQGSPLSRITGRLKNHFPTLHDSYFDNEEDAKDLTVYLTKNMRLAEVPRLAITDGVTGKTCMTDEFRAMFSECDIRDILDLLNENWRMYSTLLQPDTLQKKDKSVATASKAILEALQNTKVKTSLGNVKLGGSFLPGIDPLMDWSDTLPTLVIGAGMESLTRQRLQCLGVTVECDLSFFVSCLRALRAQSAPDSEAIGHAYGRIETMIATDEAAVNTALASDEDALIAVRPIAKSNAKSRLRWLTVKECNRMRIEPSKQYPKCPRLWRSLFGDGSLNIETVLSEVLKIRIGSPLLEVTKSLLKLSVAIKEGNQKVANAIKKLRKQAFLPVTSENCQRDFDMLMSPEDQDWYIADKPGLQQSFAGKLPLLALTHSNELDAISSLIDKFKWSRKLLSREATMKSSSSGSPQESVSMARFFAKRMPFVQALVPLSFLNRAERLEQLDTIHFYIAAEILQWYSMKVGDTIVQGRSINVSATVQYTAKSLRLYQVKEQNSTSELVALIAESCEITDPTRLGHLYGIFSMHDINECQALFARNGYVVILRTDEIRVDREEPGAQSVSPVPTAKRYLSRSGDVDYIPSPFEKLEEAANSRQAVLGQLQGPRSARRKRDAGLSEDAEIEERARILAERLKESRKSRQWELPSDGPDRRVKSNVSGDTAQFPDQQSDPMQHMQYIGERLVSILFEKHLGTIYEAERHWTSKLRARAGFAEPIALEIAKTASFTIPEDPVSHDITKFLAKHADPNAASWADLCPTYHFEIAISVGRDDEPFTWTAAQLERSRHYCLPRGQPEAITDVVILVRISNALKNPQVRFVINPFDFFVSGTLRLEQDSSFRASMPAGEKMGLLAHEYLEERQLSLVKWQQLVPENRLAGPLDSLQVYPAGPMAGAEAYGGHMDWPGRTLYTPAYPFPTQPSYMSYPYLPSGAYDFWNQRMQRANRLQIVYDSWGQRMQHVNRLPANNTYGASSAGLTSTPNLRLEATMSRSQPNSIKKLVDPAESPYQYHPLRKNQFRLLMIYPAAWDEPLQGMMCTMSCSTPGRYRALSYVWGQDDPLRLRAALTTPDGCFKIRLSLRNALGALRDESDKVLIWVDAICINQEDNREKAEQIPNLAKICQRASCTYAHLSNDNNIARGAAAMRAISLHLPSENGKESEEEDRPILPPSWQETGMPPLSDSLWTDVLALFDQPWFRRAWVVQEVVIAPTIVMVCGKHRIDWNHVFRATEAIQRAWARYGLDCSSLQPFLKLAQLREWEYMQKRWPLLRLLETFRHTKSTLHRDRFFSLLSIASDGNLAAFEPNYDCPLEEIVKRLALSIISNPEADPMRLLCRAGISSQQDRFPSWIPDWTIEKARCLYDAGRDRGVNFETSGDLLANVKHMPGTIELLIEMFVVDTVSNVSRFSNIPGEHAAGYFNEVDSMANSLRHFYDEDDVAEMKWAVPIADATDPPMLARGNCSVEESYITFREFLSHSVAQDSTYEQIDDYEKEAQLREKAEIYQDLLADVLAGWRFLTTETKKLCGIAPQTVEAGDLVVVLRGSDLPFIVRKVHDQEGAVRLVGESFVRGIMSGEALGWEGVESVALRVQ